MQQARLLTGVPIQIQFPRGIERSKSGAIYLQIGNPVQITDDEANYIKKLLDNQLKNFKIVIEEIEIKKKIKNQKTEALKEIKKEVKEITKKIAKRGDSKKKKIKRKKS